METVNLQKKEPRWLTAVLVCLAVTGVYFAATTRSTLWDRDEPNYARVAVEMVESGDYLVPTLNGKPWLEKPVLHYWLMSLPIMALGPTEFACRFFSVVGVGVSCLLVYAIGRRLLGSQDGLWSIAILACTLMMLVMGTIATMDAVLLALMLAAMAIFIWSYERGGMSTGQMLAMGAVLGAAMLAKGPMGLLPLPVIALTLLLERRLALKNLRFLMQLFAASLIAGCIFLAWAVPADLASNGDLLRVFFGQHVVARAFRPLQHHGGNFLLYLPYYLPVVIFGFFPWTLHLPGALSVVAGARAAGRPGIGGLLIGWIVWPIVLMTLVATKLPHYILFAWPAMALAVGRLIVAARQGALTDRDCRWIRRGVWFFAPAAMLIGLGLTIGPLILDVPGLLLPAATTGLLVLISSVLAIRYQLSIQPVASAVVLLVGVAVIQISCLFGILPALERIKIAPPLARAIKAATDSEVQVAMYKYTEPTLTFYTGRIIERLHSEEQVVDWARRQQPGVLIIPRTALASIADRYGELSLRQLASVTGMDYSKNARLSEVLALVRKPED
jgi:hypothetical protein